MGIRSSVMVVTNPVSCHVSVTPKLPWFAALNCIGLLAPGYPSAGPPVLVVVV